MNLNMSRFLGFFLLPVLACLGHTGWALYFFSMLGLFGGCVEQNLLCLRLICLCFFCFHIETRLTVYRFFSLLCCGIHLMTRVNFIEQEFVTSFNLIVLIGCECQN